MELNKCFRENKVIKKNYTDIENYELLTWDLAIWRLNEYVLIFINFTQSRMYVIRASGTWNISNCQTLTLRVTL